MKRGRLISLEGIDGVGKTTCASMLCREINKYEKCVYVNRKTIPCESEYIKLHMEYLYAVLWGKGVVFSKAPNIEYNGLTLEHWRHLMIAWYCAFEQHMIFPFLDKGVSVITDGYLYKEIVKAIYSTGDFNTEQCFDFLYKPDIVFYLIASPKDCMRDNANSNRIESGTFAGAKGGFVKHQTDMKYIYDKMASEKKWNTIIRKSSVESTCYDILSVYKKKYTKI